ncbi:uncharacterized protein LOC119078223 [Bradysia coprophila]|uniref:uncharacterized protein LOC119078223 n=1 Tax=Bradysia coprophila TaxID=38358 RepID=UPI00187DA00C|nr:uncharacterized protein LOC119078223 [Bradysia coprophila]
MSKGNINDLPREVLEDVFRYLDGKNMKNATLTCKWWKELIEFACRWSLELDYSDKARFLRKDTSYDTDHKINFILTTKRKFGTIRIIGGHLTEHTQIQELFRTHGFCVVKLCLLFCSIDNVVAFAELLNATPNLKHAVMMNVHSVRDEQLGGVSPDLKKLKTLEMSDVQDHRIFECFKNAKLTTIKIWEEEPSQHLGALENFLSSQDMLTSLNVHWSCRILAEMGKLEVPVPFRLRRLSISDLYLRNTPIDQHHLMTFIQSQAELLEEMEIGFGIPPLVYEYVFTRMKKLNTLKLEVGPIPHDPDFYDQLPENGSVRALNLLDNELNEIKFVSLANFVKKLPGVRSLIVPFAKFYASKNALIAMAQNLSHVESLSIGTVNENSVDFVKFPHLKTLHIQLLRVKVDWNVFSKNHPRLAELSIEEMEKSYFTSDDIDRITTNVDLRIIRLGAGFVADNRFFEIIRAKCANLNVLDLHESCIPHGLKAIKAIE